MTSRQRGATWLLALILVGRLLDALDLPFEHGMADPPELTTPAAADSIHHGGDPQARLPGATAAADSAAPEPTPDAPLAINSADVRELQRLPRVGPVLAQRIVDWRQEHGPFRSPSDLQRVRGIGRNTAAQLAPLVRFD